MYDEGQGACGGAWKSLRRFSGVLVLKVSVRLRVRRCRGLNPVWVQKLATVRLSFSFRFQTRGQYGFSLRCAASTGFGRIDTPVNAERR